MQHLKTSLPLNYPQLCRPCPGPACCHTSSSTPSIDNVQISALLTGRTELARALCQVLRQVLVGGGLELEKLQEGDIKVRRQLRFHCRVETRCCRRSIGLTIGFHDHGEGQFRRLIVCRAIKTTPAPAGGGPGGGGAGGRAARRHGGKPRAELPPARQLPGRAARLPPHQRGGGGQVETTRKMKETMHSEAIWGCIKT